MGLAFLKLFSEMQKGADCPLLHFVCIYDYIDSFTVLCWIPFRITIQFLRRFFVGIIESAYNGTAGGVFAEKKTILYILPLTLDIFSGKIILCFRGSGKSADFPEPHLRGEGRNGKRHLQRRFLRKHGAGAAFAPREGRLPPAGEDAPQVTKGESVAQRLRGYKWRSEKSVKAIAPTGAALAFLCFDFFLGLSRASSPWPLRGGWSPEVGRGESEHPSLSLAQRSVFAR